MRRRRLSESPGERAAEEAAAAAEAQRLANARGGLIITTEPAGAEVTVGGVARERTPTTLKDVKLGTYPVVVSRVGYEDQRLEAEVKENEFATLNVTLVRSTGALSIASNPPGLGVTIQPDNGVGGSARTVRTPEKLEGLPTGSYTLTYRREGWPEQTRTVEVERNGTASALAEFIGGGLSITSTPAGAEVFQGEKRLGVTPLSFADLLPGRFDLALRIKGHAEARWTGEVKSRETARVAVTLEEIQGPRVGESYMIDDLNLELVPIAPGTLRWGREAPVTG